MSFSIWMSWLWPLFYQWQTTPLFARQWHIIQGNRYWICCDAGAAGCQLAIFSLTKRSNDRCGHRITIIRYLTFILKFILWLSVTNNVTRHKSPETIAEISQRKTPSSCVCAVSIEFLRLPMSALPQRCSRCIMTWLIYLHFFSHPKVDQKI